MLWTMQKTPRNNNTTKKCNNIQCRNAIQTTSISSNQKEKKGKLDQMTFDWAKIVYTPSLECF
jgi:hypothetical protein